MRQLGSEQEIFRGIIMHIREGIISRNDYDVLKSRFVREPKTGIPCLFARNVDVEEYNNLF